MAGDVTPDRGSKRSGVMSRRTARLRSASASTVAGNSEISGRLK
jgi:hypothetical protein